MRKAILLTDIENLARSHLVGRDHPDVAGFMEQVRSFAWTHFGGAVPSAGGLGNADGGGGSAAAGTTFVCTIGASRSDSMPSAPCQGFSEGLRQAAYEVADTHPNALPAKIMHAIQDLAVAIYLEGQPEMTAEQAAAEFHRAPSAGPFHDAMLWRLSKALEKERTF